MVLGRLVGPLQVPVNDRLDCRHAVKRFQDHQHRVLERDIALDDELHDLVADAVLQRLAVQVEQPMSP